jgi:hypothetical protein
VCSDAGEIGEEKAIAGAGGGYGMVNLSAVHVRAGIIASHNKARHWYRWRIVGPTFPLAEFALLIVPDWSSAS